MRKTEVFSVENNRTVQSISGAVARKALSKETRPISCPRELQSTSRVQTDCI